MLYLPALAHRVGPAAVTKLSGASGLVWAALWASLGLLMPETAPKPALASLPDPEAPEPSEGAVGPVDTRLQDKGEYPTIGRSNAPQIDPAALRGGVRGPRSNAEGVGVAQGTAHSNAPRSNIFGAVERWVWGHRVGDSDKLGEKGIRASSQTLMGRVTLAAELLRHPAIGAFGRVMSAMARCLGVWWRVMSAMARCLGVRRVRLDGVKVAMRWHDFL